MIDLHCHILPAVDDGAPDLAVSVAMARMCVADGVSAVACTPHIQPGVYRNDGPGICAAVARLQGMIDADGLPLRLVEGADVHIAAGLIPDIRAGRIPTIAGSRYILIEAPHHIAPKGLETLLFDLHIAGYVPILTHPERLAWIESRYGLIGRLAQAGAWMQLTAGSLAGTFGRTARYWAERMLDEGLVHVIATDAHDAGARRPDMRRGFELAAARVGVVEAEHLVLTRPRGVLGDADPDGLPRPSGIGREAGGTDGYGRLPVAVARGNARTCHRNDRGRSRLGWLRRVVGASHRIA